MARVTPRPLLAPPEYVEVAGIKALHEPARIALRPLTLLAGGNSSGKSSAMQPLLLFKQTFESTFDPGTLRLNGSHVAFTHPDELLSRGTRKDSTARAMRVTLGPRAVWSQAVPGLVRSVATPPIVLEVRKRWATGFELEPLAVEAIIDGALIRILDGMSVEDFVRIHRTYHPAAIDDASLKRGHVFVDFGRPLPRVVLRRVLPTRAPDLDLDVHGWHEDWIGAILHVPGLRGHRERRFPATRRTEKRGALRVDGPFTPYVASLLADWQRGESDHVEEIGSDLRTLGLTWKVRAEQVNAAELAIRVGRTLAARQGGANDLVDIADVGFGVSQVLPVVVALRAAAPGQIVYVEQPELHLHPRAQATLGGLLAAAAARGVFVVAETHSRQVLRAVQTAVAREVLGPEKVAMHWFARDDKSGFATVVRAELDAKGAFGDWPVDFSDADAEADAAWLGALYPDWPA